jgi:hypothetical protein
MKCKFLFVVKNPDLQYSSSNAGAIAHESYTIRHYFDEYLTNMDVLVISTADRTYKKHEGYGEVDPGCSVM